MLFRFFSSTVGRCIVFTVLIFLQLNSFQSISLLLLVGVVSFNFFNYAGIFLSMTIILYIAIVHPLYYRTHVSTSTCINILIGIIFVSIAITLTVKIKKL